MRMYDIIEKKKRGKELDKQEIKFVVEGFTSGQIPDYQMSAFLMAVYFSGLNKTETYELTMAMKESGESLDLSEIVGVKVDKHSTGGVGDKTTLIVGPIVASLGIPVAKMSGRGLGHTGGTIDKLESIPGFNTAISKEQFINQVNSVHMAVAGQTSNLAPADKKIYALRDVTATVDSIPLIASSIMSKKLASGADAVVLDVKCGNGAFMKSEEEAFRLAEEMVDIGKKAGRSMTAIVTDMNEPLGRYVGNSLEVYEAVQCLRGLGDEKLMEVCYVLASYMIMAAGQACEYKDAYDKAVNSVKNGDALRKMAEFVAAQGGDNSYVNSPEKLSRGNIKIELKSEKAGFVSYMDTELVGKTCLALGGGRETKNSTIDLNVGIYLNKKKGEYVNEGETLAVVYADDGKRGEEGCRILKEAYCISDKKIEENSIVKKIID